MLLNPKTRTKFTRALAHFRDIDPGCKRAVLPSLQSPKGIEQILIAKGAPAVCYLIAEHPKMDGRELPLTEALEETVGSGMGAILSCIPGQLAFIETEDERFILEKLKKPLRPRQCVRFIASKIDPDSRVEEGIFSAAVRLRDEGPRYQREELRSQLDWFNQHLPEPAPLNHPRNKRAISWFKCESKDCITRIWSVVHILEENGVRIEKITADHPPGNVIYEDEWQVVAKPFGE